MYYHIHWHFADKTFKLTFFKYFFFTLIQFPLKFVSEVPFNNIGLDDGLALDRWQAIIWTIDHVV